MEPLTLAVVALVILAAALVSGRIAGTPLTLPMLFVLCGIAVGPLGLGLIRIDVESPLVRLIAELTLVLVLFTDASRIDLGLLRRHHEIPVRMLTLGLPLTMLLGAAAALAIFADLQPWEAVVLAIILAPTDAALGQAVVSSPVVPVRIRQALNVESGLNDGLALPVLLLFLCVAGASEHGTSAADWVWLAARQLTLGPLAGVAVGFLGGRLLLKAQQRGWMQHAFLDLCAIGLSLLAFASAELLGGNGFIAAFCAGLVLGNTARGICACLYEFAEAEGQLLTLLTFLIFRGGHAAAGAGPPRRTHHPLRPAQFDGRAGSARGGQPDRCSAEMGNNGLPRLVRSAGHCIDPLWPAGPGGPPDRREGHDLHGDGTDGHVQRRAPWSERGSSGRALRTQDVGGGRERSRPRGNAGPRDAPAPRPLARTSHEAWADAAEMPPAPRRLSRQRPGRSAESRSAARPG